MIATFWEWLIYSEQGMGARIGCGVAIFLALAAWDLWGNGWDARRLRDYVFLLAAMGTTILYGLLNDHITVSISREFFLYGQWLIDKLGASVSQSALRYEAIKMHIAANWSAGLVLGVLILFVNNGIKQPQAPYRVLYRLLALPAICAATAAALLGVIFWAGLHSGLLNNLLNHTDFLDVPTRARVFAVYGVNWGGYIGAIAGTVWAVIHIRRVRRMLMAKRASKV